MIAVLTAAAALLGGEHRVAADDTISREEMDLASQLFTEAYRCPIPESKSSVTRSLTFDLGDFIHIRNRKTSNSGNFDEEVSFALRNVDEVTSGPDNNLLFTCRPGETCVSKSSGTSCTIGQKCKVSNKNRKGSNHYGTISNETSFKMRLCDANALENALFAIRPIMRHIKALQRDPASFDCYEKFSSNASRVDVAICSSQKIRRLDKQLSTVLERAKFFASTEDQDRLTTTQASWRAALEFCLRDDTEKCLATRYGDRMTKVILQKY
jgi:hypothetical protein